MRFLKLYRRHCSKCKIVFFWRNYVEITIFYAEILRSFFTSEMYINFSNQFLKREIYSTSFSTSCRKNIFLGNVFLVLFFPDILKGQHTTVRNDTYIAMQFVFLNIYLNNFESWCVGLAKVGFRPGRVLDFFWFGLVLSGKCQVSGLILRSKDSKKILYPLNLQKKNSLYPILVLGSDTNFFSLKNCKKISEIL